MNREYFDQILSLSILGNDVKTYVIAAIVLAGIFVFFKFMFMMIFKRLESYAKHTKTDIDDAVVILLERNRWMVFLVLAFLYIDVALSLPVEVEAIIKAFFNISAVVLAVRVSNYWVEYFTEKIAHDKKNAAEEFSVRFISKALKVLVWVFGILFLISSFGYNISSLIAGLGIGGLAVALAVQNILGDLISCISIYLDKPFRVGDYIIVGEQMGTVKSIGIKTTRITSIHGEEIVMSNKRLTESDINNYGRMRKRRVLIPLGVTYKTPLRKMKAMPTDFKKIVESVKDTEFDRAYFKTFGASSKEFELVFYVSTKDFYTYIDRLEQVNLGIQQYFEKKKIDFAFPTQTVYLKKR
jgi:small-conductance mechanosensitive channel